MDISKKYKQLTNVDIEKQKQLWDERGKGYYGEYLVFCELYKHIAGNCKILMNLNIPVSEQKTTEIDLLLIHETGLYVFEIKHYKGTIYGKDTDNTWTQYFRTAANNTFNNPIKQNDYHLKALKNMFPDLSFRSIIVFTSDECELKITNSNTETDVCCIYDIDKVLSYLFKKRQETLTNIDIDNLFIQFKEYSQMNDSVEIDGTEEAFLSWIQPAINMLNSKKDELEEERIQLEKSNNSLKKAKLKGWLTNAFVAIICVALSLCFVFGAEKYYNTKIQENNAELARFKQKFVHVDEINNEYIDDLSSYVDVSDVNLSALTDDAVSFSAKLSLLNDVYRILISDSAKYIVMTKSGTVYEYDLFGEHLKYNHYSNMLGDHYKMSGYLNQAFFYGISDPAEIVYIKLVNIELKKADMNSTLIKDGLEIELYVAP